MVDFIGDLMRGGKRLRPAFCYWGWRGAGGEDRPDIVIAASALEFFQAAALIHDDVMDDSDTRRGLPSVHRRFAAVHDQAGWRGEGHRFGQAGAILAGDLCLVWSDELFTASGLAGDTPRGGRGRMIFDRMRTELMAGQYLDMLEQALTTRAPAEAVQRARRVIRYKSAKYTIEQPLLIGGALAGGDDALLASYAAFGLPLGEAFQLRDDVLGVFGDPATTGKPAGDDLREGKRTVLVALASHRATPAAAERLERLLGDPDLDADGVEACRTILHESGAVGIVEGLIAELAEQAQAALAAGPALLPEAVEVLDALVGAATDRTS
ncbi:MAG: polyprenyl synthetase family protein [Kineosporiaceae bacterium]|nr:polyprenyl synthetase family protein [Kineosporiaceae bacterium]